jgi:hypothetical protein
MSRDKRLNRTQEVVSSILISSTNSFNNLARNLRSHRKMRVSTFASGSRESHQRRRRHFDISTEAVKHEVRIVAEGPTRLDQKLDRTAADVREEMRRGFADTQR